MKVQFLKKHGIYGKDDIAEVSDARGNYLVSVKAAISTDEPVKVVKKKAAKKVKAPVEKKTPTKKAKVK